MRSDTERRRARFRETVVTLVRGSTPTPAEYVWMQKKLTITVDAEVYDGLHRTIGRGKISKFIEGLLRPHVTALDLEESYCELAKNEEAQTEAAEWMNGVGRDVGEFLDAAR
jgi:predicted CopG family antitoxin